MTNEMISRIDQIGESMVHCNKNCAGVKIDIRNGYVPRCLIFEKRIDSYTTGCVIVGESPGFIRDYEAKQYKKILEDNGTLTYRDIKELWDKNLVARDYYEKIRDRFLDELIEPRNILWTDIVKCEIADPKQEPRLITQTVRNCVKLYLLEELKAVPSRWPIIALGPDIYKTVALLALDRTIIGLYHPSNRSQQYNKCYLDSNRKIKPQIRERFSEVVNNDKKESVFIGKEPY